MIEVHWVKAIGGCCSKPHHDKYHGTFKNVDEAYESIRQWWAKNNFEPSFVRWQPDERGDIWLDYGPHSAFYVLKEA